MKPVRKPRNRINQAVKLRRQVRAGKIDPSQFKEFLELEKWRRGKKSLK